MEQHEHPETNGRNEENARQEGSATSMCVVVDSGEIWTEDENQT